MENNVNKDCPNSGIAELLDGSWFSNYCCAACEAETQQHECYKMQLLKGDGMFQPSQLKRQKERAVYRL
jgi:hypothetical protein